VVQLAARTWGDAADPSRPLAALVHGVTSSSRTWWRVGPALAERGFRVLAVDLRGHGASPRQVAGLAAADLAADVAETVAERAAASGLGGPGAEGGGAGASPGAGAAGTVVDLLVGHSLGALVALELVTARPGFARRLVLEDPPGPSSVDWAGLAAGIEADHRRAVHDPEGLRRDLEAQNPAWPPGEAERRVADLADCDAPAIAAALRPGVPFDLAGLLAAARLPVLLLLAEEALGSSIVGVDRKAAMAAAGAEGSGEPQGPGGSGGPQGGPPAGRAPDNWRATRVLPAGHSIHREALDAWLAALDAWLVG
jgi:pimeloyl-ACP methyl ester carboxylesterase